MNQKISRKKSDNEITATQNLWDAAKAVLRWKFVAIQSYLNKQEKTSNKEPNFTPKTTEKNLKNKKTPKFVEVKKS